MKVECWVCSEVIEDTEAPKHIRRHSRQFGVPFNIKLRTETEQIPIIFYDDTIYTHDEFSEARVSLEFMEELKKYGYWMAKRVKVSRPDLVFKGFVRYKWVVIYKIKR